MAVENPVVGEGTISRQISCAGKVDCPITMLGRQLDPSRFEESLDLMEKQYENRVFTSSKPDTFECWGTRGSAPCGRIIFYRKS